MTKNYMSEKHPMLGATDTQMLTFEAERHAKERQLEEYLRQQASLLGLINAVETEKSWTKKS